jgi:hypothetical protein
MQENNPYAVLFGSIELQSEEHIDLILGVMDKEPDDTGMMQDVPYFDPKFLVEKYLKLSKSDIDRNEDMKKERKDEMEKQKKASGGDDDGGGLGF